MKTGKNSPLDEYGNRKKAVAYNEDGEAVMWADEPPYNPVQIQTFRGKVRFLSEEYDIKPEK